MRPKSGSGLGICLVVLGLTWVAHAEAQESADGASASAAGAEEKTVKDADKAEAPKVKAEETEDEEGVKTFRFGAVEVEGRLKAPQILYFLRRVRAEFRAGLLGHRSFLPELSDTRRSPALR